MDLKIDKIIKDFQRKINNNGKILVKNRNIYCVEIEVNRVFILTIVISVGIKIDKNHIEIFTIHEKNVTILIEANFVNYRVEMVKVSVWITVKNGYRWIIGIKIWKKQKETVILENLNWWVVCLINRNKQDKTEKKVLING